MNGAAGIPGGAHEPGGHSCGASGPPRPPALSPTSPLPGKREGPRAVPVCEGWRRAGSSLPGEGAACEGLKRGRCKVKCWLRVFRAGVVTVVGRTARSPL